MEDSFWTEERDQILRDRWSDESRPSADTIGQEIGASRDAVAGRVRRLGLPKRGTKGRARPGLKIAQDLTHSDDPYPNRCGLLQLNEMTCRWPVGDPGDEDFFFCGSDVSVTPRCSSYCLAHRLVAYEKGRAQ